MAENLEKVASKKTSLEVDNALESTPAYTPEEEGEVLKNIDRVVLPLMCFVQFFSCKLDLAPRIPETVKTLVSLTVKKDLDKQCKLPMDSMVGQDD